mgnify:CR=1 FL=1
MRHVGAIMCSMIWFFFIFDRLDAVFIGLLYHTFRNMVIVRLGNLSSLCSPGNQDYQKIIYFLFFSSKKVEIGDQILITKNI